MPRWSLTGSGRLQEQQYTILEYNFAPLADGNSRDSADVLNILFIWEVIFEQYTVLPTEKFASFVLSRNTLMLQQSQHLWPGPNAPPLKWLELVQTAYLRPRSFYCEFMDRDEVNALIARELSGSTSTLSLTVNSKFWIPHEAAWFEFRMKRE